MKKFLLLALLLCLFGCFVEGENTPIKKASEIPSADKRHFVITGSGKLRSDEYDKRYIVIRDSDAKVDYLIVESSGVIKLEPKLVQIGVEPTK